MLLPTIILFDIDGTIISTGGAGRRAIARALDVSGESSSIDFSFAGMTDRGIVRKALEVDGRRVTESVIDRVLSAYLDALAHEIDTAPEEDYVVHEGIEAAIEAALAAEHVACGLGTGNIEAGARLKLARVGFSKRFDFGGFGCDAEDRASLLHAGAERGATRLGHPMRMCRTVIVGDSPRDIKAAHAIGAQCLAVATGVFDEEQLRAYDPDRLVANMTAEGAIDWMLHG